MKRFTQNIIKVIFTSIFPHLIITISIVALFFIIKNNVIKNAILTGGITYIFILIRFWKLISSDFKRTVEINDDKLICKSFVINGNTVADGEIPYKLMKNIKFKRSIIPGVKCIFIEISDNPKTPLIITNTYHNYKELWSSVCQKVREINPYSEIDNKIFKQLSK